MLSAQNDTDGDGLNDALEWKLAEFGFSWQFSDQARLAKFQQNAHRAGLLTEPQLRSQDPGSQLLKCDPSTGQASFLLRVQRSTALAGFADSDVTAATIDPAGNLLVPRLRQKRPGSSASLRTSSHRPMNERFIYRGSGLLLALLVSVSLLKPVVALPLIAAGGHVAQEDGRLWKASLVRSRDGTWIPGVLLGDLQWRSLASGYGVKDQGTLWSFPWSTPTQVGTATDWRSTHAAAGRWFAIKRDGTLWAAGNGISGIHPSATLTV